MHLLGDTHLRQIEAHLARVLKRLFKTPVLRPLDGLIQSYILAGGKRLRPQLCAWTYLNLRRTKNGPLPAVVLDLGAGWEMFHAFLLCHDDIIDGADRRRDGASLHRQLQSLDHNCPRFGMNLGIVAGDLMFSAAMRLWHELDLSPRQLRDELKLFSRIACATGFGQAIDIAQSHVPLDDVREKTLLREYHWKTAAYTFEGPMLSGAIAAGAGTKTCAAISAFALSVGQAYQLHNDLADLSSPVHEGSDLMQGKRTVTLIRARQSMGVSERRDFDRKFAGIATANGEALALCESLRRELCAGNAIAGTRKLIDQYLARAGRVSRDNRLPVPFRHRAVELLGSLRENHFDRQTKVALS